MYFMPAIMLHMIVSLVWGGIQIAFYILVWIGCTTTAALAWVYDGVIKMVSKYNERKGDLK